MRTDADAEEDQALNIVPKITPGAEWRVSDVQPLTGHRLRVRFNDGTQGDVDMAEFVRCPHAGVFAPLRDEGIFRQVQVILGAVTWPGGLDLAPDAMCPEIKRNGVWVLR